MANIKITERIDNITHMPSAYYNATIPAPPAAKIELTSRCNFKCAFCATGQNLRPKKDMDKGLFKKVATELREAGVDDIGLFFLGESFLVPWLPWAINFLKEELNTSYVFLTTNGSASTPMKMRECFEAGLDSLKFSFNYADAEQFATVTNVNPRLFGNVLSNVRKSRAIRDEVERSTGRRCNLFASYILFDGEQGDKMKELVAELETILDEVYQLPLYSHGDLASEGEHERGWAPDGGNRGRKGALVPHLPCWVLFTEAHICYDGALAGCCFDHSNIFDMGNLNDISFMEAWNSPKFVELRQHHLNLDVHGTACEDCIYGSAKQSACKTAATVICGGCDG